MRADGGKDRTEGAGTSVREGHLSKLWGQRLVRNDRVGCHPALYVRPASIRMGSLTRRRIPSSHTTERRISYAGQGYEAAEVFRLCGFDPSEYGDHQGPMRDQWAEHVRRVEPVDRLDAQGPGGTSSGQTRNQRWFDLAHHAKSVGELKNQGGMKWA